MPVIRVDGPKVTDLSRKRDFVKHVTDAACKFYDLPRQSIVVLLQESTPDNVGVGGELLVDRASPEKK